jgi:amidase
MAQLTRIQVIDPRLHAYTTVLADTALAQARKMDQDLAAGRNHGPLHGVPVAVKDLFLTRGVPAKAGTRVLANVVPDRNATVIDRLEDAGAVLLGKLNMTEGALAGYHRDFSVPRNPWGENRWPGFSSSGAGVATAAGLCYASLGTDTGGSIRYPSAANGVVGMKPTWGRVSRFGVLPLAPPLDHVGPLTRRVLDAAIVLQVIAGDDKNDPTSLPDPVPDYVKESGKGIKNVRIGFDDVYATQGVPTHVADSLRKAIGDLEKLGARIIPVKMPTMEPADLANLWNTLCAAEAFAAHESSFRTRPDDYGVFIKQFLQTGSAITGSEYAKARSAQTEFNGKVRQALRAIDVLACPTASAEAPIYDPESAYGGRDATSYVGIPLSYMRAGLRFIFPYDFNGYPTLSLPCGRSEDGLPLSLQLVGHPLSEAMLFRLGRAYEDVTEWHRRHPPI